MYLADVEWLTAHRQRLRRILQRAIQVTIIANVINRWAKELRRENRQPMRASSVFVDASIAAKRRRSSALHFFGGHFQGSWPWLPVLEPLVIA